MKLRGSQTAADLGDLLFYVNVKLMIRGAESWRD
jgi:hypothetical protein